jgi:hypothetical protein
VRAIFNTVGFRFDAEGHNGGLVGNSKPPDQLQEIRVGDFVENDETRIDGIAVCPEIHIDGVCVAANVIVPFKQNDVVVLVQKERTDQSRNPASNNCDFHRNSIVPPGASPDSNPLFQPSVQPGRGKTADSIEQATPADVDQRNAEGPIPHERIVGHIVDCINHDPVERAPQQCRA